MQRLLNDVTELCNDWDVWSVTASDVNANSVTVTRSDEDLISITVTVAASYPSGSLTMRDTFGRKFEGRNIEFGDALDEALQQWDEEADHSSAMPREGTSMLFDAATTGAGGSEADIVPSIFARAEAHIQKHASDPRVQNLTWFSFDQARRKFIMRVACPLATMEQFRANALNLDRNHAVVAELHFSWQYLETSSPPTVMDIYTAPVRAIAADNTIAQRSIGALRWFLKNRIETALAKNWVNYERVRQKYTAEENAACPDLDRFRASVPEEHFIEGDDMNLFAGLVQLLEYRIRSCTTLCLICDSPLPLEGMKLATCDKELCNHSAESYGLGCDVLYELQHHPEVSELLICLTLYASQSGVGGRDVLVPMCPVCINPSAVPGYHGPLHFYSNTYGDEKKNYQLLVDQVQQLPPVKTMVRMADNDEATLRNKLNEMSPLLFPLLRWILSSNRAHLEPVAKEHRMKGLGDYQFHLVSSNPAKESRFLDRKEKAKTKGAGNCPSGSFFTWHGSSPGNWHCILRSGLKNYSNTKLMSAGAAHGAGIYTARTMSTSIGYMGSTSAQWKGAEYFGHKSGMLLMSLCELVDDKRTKSDVTGKPSLKDATAEIVTVQDEDIIDTRFLFVFPGGFKGDASLKANSVDIPSALLRSHQ